MADSETSDSNAGPPPATLAEMHARLHHEHATLSRRLKEVADYINSHPQSLALDTLAVIAERAGVHPSTLVRFANHFGFSGFSALQQLYKDHVEQNFNDYGERIRALQLEQDCDDKVTPRSLLNEFTEANLLSLHQLRDQIDTDLLQHAVDAMDKAHSIYICGVRRAFPVAMYFAYALSHIQVRCHTIDGLGMMHEEQARGIAKDELLIAITFSPYASATHTTVERAKKNNANVMLLTDDSRLCPAAKLADVVLPVPDAQVRSFRSLNASMCLAQALCIALGYRREETRRDTQQ